MLYYFSQNFLNIRLNIHISPINNSVAKTRTVYSTAITDLYLQNDQNAVRCKKLQYPLFGLGSGKGNPLIIMQ